MALSPLLSEVVIVVVLLIKVARFQKGDMARIKCITKFFLNNYHNCDKKFINFGSSYSPLTILAKQRIFFPHLIIVSSMYLHKIDSSMLPV